MKSSFGTTLSVIVFSVLYMSIAASKRCVGVKVFTSSKTRCLVKVEVEKNKTLVKHR